MPYEDVKTFAKSFNAVYNLKPHALQLGFLKILKGSKIFYDKEQHEYCYMSVAPYQVLKNKYLTYEETCHLIILEDLFEKIYNAGRLKNLESYLIKNYYKNSDYDFLIQEKINFKNEVGIFYHRFPDEKTGKITGMVKKEFLYVKGNGKKTLKELVIENPRSAFQIKAVENEMKNEMQKIVPENVEIILVPFGSHTRGAKFIDISNEITENLVKKIDEICTNVNGFYFGRLDVMYENLEQLKDGKSFKIIEINGAKSEPRHMYDPKHSLFFAWKEIAKHWKIMAKISRKNHKAGFPYLNIKEGFLALKNNQTIEKKLRKISLVD